ncbi:MAG: Ig-like domain-containing protein [Candidatus Rifleibacteriota bacterium]
MNRWNKAALLFAILAAMGSSSPVLASLDQKSIRAETAAIKINKHFPADMAGEIPTDTPLTVEFDGATTPSFYQTANLNLFNGSEPVDGELFYNPSARQIMFKSKQKLKEGQTYTAQLSYYDGLGQTSEKVWSFQTKGGSGFQPIPSQSGQSLEGPDNEKQTANSQSYLNIADANMGSGHIEPGTQLEVTFSEPLDIVSLKSAPVKLFENNQPVGIDYKLSSDLKTLTISPRDRLKEDANYAIAVEKKLASTSGQKFHKKTLIPFRLGGNQPEVPEHEISESPAPSRKAKQHSQDFANPFSQQNSNSQKQTSQQQQSQNFSQQRSQRTQRPKRQRQPQRSRVQLIGLSPVNGAKVTNLTQPITIGFSDAIRPETLNEFTFRLEDDFGPVPAKIQYLKDKKQATLTPVGLLDSNKNYRVVVTQGVTDTHDQPIRSGINSMFSTVSPVNRPEMPEMMAQNKNQQPAPAPEQETVNLERLSAAGRATTNSYSQPSQNRNSNQRPPQRQNRRVATPSRKAPANRRVRTRPNRSQLKPFKVAAVFPGIRNKKVSRKSKIAVHFSEPADPSTVDHINISIFGNQTRVPGKVSYDQRKNRAVFTPESPLDSNTEYKVIVSDNIKSKMGEQLASNFSWEFTTDKNIRHRYTPRKKAEADAAFFIPLVDSQLKERPGQEASKIKNNTKSNTDSAFNFVNSRHWAFKSVRHITNRGMLNTFPFVYTDNVTRYEFTTAINLALNNLKAMQYMRDKPKLKIADMVELQKLIVEFKRELKACAVNTSWFESFLQKQGVNLRQVEMKVKKLNQG